MSIHHHPNSEITLLLRRLLNPEDLGHAAGARLRDIVRFALGQEMVEESWPRDAKWIEQNLLASVLHYPGCWDTAAYPTLASAIKEIAAFKCSDEQHAAAQEQAPTMTPFDLIQVTREDGNNYCRILRVLGMEEEGDPVAEVRRLVAREQAPAVLDLIAERLRQVSEEGYEHAHDDEHVGGEIAAYAAFFALPPAAREWPATETGYGSTFGKAIVPMDWPMPKEGDRRRELVKAGALILAEIERIDRAAQQSLPQQVQQ